MWKFNKSTHQWDFTYEDEVVFKVSEEQWVEFLITYGGDIFSHRGINIPVPTYKAYLDDQGLRQQNALLKVLQYMMLGEKNV